METLISRKALLLSTALISSTLAAGPVLAQTQSPPSPATAQAPSPAPDTNHLEDIVVTARRTKEALQTTPVAVTAITPLAMTTRQLSSVNDIQRSAPGLVLSPNGGANAAAVYVAIRGNTQSNLISTADNAIGIYVDGVYIARAQTGNLALDDLASVEVLRGPQGTLFGRNTTGGAINLTTNNPDPSKFSGWVEAGFGNYAEREFKALLNVPITDTLAIRGSVSYDHHDGYLNAPFAPHNLDGVRADWNGRVSIRWTPTAIPLTWKISADYSHYRDYGSGGAFFTDPSVNIFPDATQYINTKSNFWTSYSKPQTSALAILDNPFNFNVAKGIASNLDIDLDDHVHFKSITAYRRSRSVNATDADVTPEDILNFESYYEQQQFSQELQFNGKWGKFDVTTGLYYFHEHGQDGGPSDVLPVFGTVPYSLNNAGYSATSQGAFVQANYRVTDRLRITGGIRYTWDDRAVVNHGSFFPHGPDAVVGGQLNPAVQVCNAGMQVGVPYSLGTCSDPQKAKFSYPAWTGSIDYRLTNTIFAYLKTSGAALAGGLNSRQFPAGFAAFAPEKVKDIEAGFKADLFDRKVRLNGAVFYMWRDHVQNVVNEFVGGVLANFITNAGNTRTYGAEFETTILPWHGMEIDGSLSYLHTRYVKGSFLVEGENGPYDRSGEPVLYAPKWTANIGGTQNFDVGPGKLAVHADYYYISGIHYFTDSLDPTVSRTPAELAAEQQLYDLVNKYGKIAGHGVINARVAYTFNQPKIEIAGWVRNLAAAKYFTNGLNFISGLGYAVKYQGAPRTFGATATLHF